MILQGSFKSDAERGAFLKSIELHALKILDNSSVGIGLGRSRDAKRKSSLFLSRLSASRSFAEAPQ
jgi:hypothetical protein